jgi:hypothetical protein
MVGIVSIELNGFREAGRVLPWTGSGPADGEVQDCVAAGFQPSLRDWIVFSIQPRTSVLG